MKKYLLSLVCVSGAILAMAGPAQEEFVAILKKKTGIQNITIEQTAKQGKKLVVAGKINRKLFITRFNPDGTYDGTFGIEKIMPGQAFSIDSLEISENNIKVKGEAIWYGWDDDYGPYEINWDAQGKLKNLSRKGSKEK